MGRCDAVTWSDFPVSLRQSREVGKNASGELCFVFMQPPPMPDRWPCVWSGSHYSDEDVRSSTAAWLGRQAEALISASHSYCALLFSPGGGAAAMPLELDLGGWYFFLIRASLFASSCDCLQRQGGLYTQTSLLCWTDSWNLAGILRK